jgi:hypothetical protein
MELSLPSAAKDQMQPRSPCSAAPPCKPGAELNGYQQWRTFMSCDVKRGARVFAYCAVDATTQALVCRDGHHYVLLHIGSCTATSFSDWRSAAPQGGL